jgi:hypothetical protein
MHLCVVRGAAPASDEALVAPPSVEADDALRHIQSTRMFASRITLEYVAISELISFRNSSGVLPWTS